VKFFFDNNLAPKIAHGLSKMVEPQHRVIHLKDKFVDNAEDAEWMRKLAEEEDWVIVTADIRISRNPHEVAAWKEAGHTIFFLKPGWTDLTFWDQVNKFTKCFPQLIETALHSERGSGFSVTVNGKIEPLK
jgi:PIN like domain